MHFKIALFNVALMRALRKSLGEKYVVLLIHYSVTDLQRSKERHSISAQASLLAQFATRHRFRISICDLPASLRKLHTTPPDRVAELLDQV